MNFKTLLTASAIMALAAFATGCGNVCDDAADLCAEAADGEATDGEDVECEGAVECAAQCIVDADSCEATEELATCYADCA